MTSRGIGGTSRVGSGPGRAAPARGFGERFELFAECLLTGILVVVAALGVVTTLAALAAGCRRVRALVDAEPATLADFLGTVRSALSGSVRWSLLLLGGYLVLGVDLVLARSGAVPGADAVLPVVLGILMLVTVVVLRAAAGWRTGAAWSVLLRTASRRSVVVDLSGSVLLAGALVVVVAVSVAVPPLALPVVGVLVMAAVAVEDRAEGVVFPDRPGGRADD
jgi:hypothetical protein